jgi:hypothetical protein
MIQSCWEAGTESMMGSRQIRTGCAVLQVDTHVPADHLLRSIDRFVELRELRRELAPFYSTKGRPSAGSVVAGPSSSIPYGTRN